MPLRYNGIERVNELLVLSRYYIKLNVYFRPLFSVIQLFTYILIKDYISLKQKDIRKGQMVY